MTVRALIVDDSPTMRSLIAALLRADPEIQIIGAASTASEARGMIRDLDPDVVTLDIEMPGMDGIAFLEKIMRLRPTPVVMVSTLTAKGAAATIRALTLGAVDCYEKPSGGMTEMLSKDAGRLANMVKAAALCKIQMQGRLSKAAASLVPAKQWNGRMIAIAASTGGVEALTSLIGSFPENCPPTLIVQHMPPLYTAMLARSLHTACAPQVCEAQHGQPIQQGHVYIAPSGAQHLRVGGAGQPYCELSPSDPVNGHRPSGDTLFHSLARFSPDRAVGVILTGMGDDGARGLAAMRAAGFPTLGQSADSALIYGMPRAAVEMGAVAEVMALEAMPARLMEYCTC